MGNTSSLLFKKNSNPDLIMKSLIVMGVIISAVVLANASGPAPPPPPPPPPPPAHYRPRPPPYGYRPSYIPSKHGGFGGNSLLPLLLLGKNCKDAPDCVKPNTGTTLCGKSSPANLNVKECCVCSGGLFGI